MDSDHTSKVTLLHYLHIKLSTSILRFLYWPVYWLLRPFYLIARSFYRSVVWVFTSLYRVIRAISYGFAYVFIRILYPVAWIYKGSLYFFGAIITIWFAPALLLKALGLEALSNIVGVICLVIGLAFFAFALKPMIGDWIYDFERR
jgi:hypothetical protein